MNALLFACAQSRTRLGRAGRLFFWLFAEFTVKEVGEYQVTEQRQLASSECKLGNHLRNRKILVCDDVQFF